MGKHFGELAFIRGLIYYRLSPHELKAWGPALTEGTANFVPRTLHRIWTWLPPFVCGYLLYSVVEHGHHANTRKNPRDFMYEVDPNPPMICKRQFEPRSPCKKPSAEPVEVEVECDK